MSDHLDDIVPYLQILPPGMDFCPDDDELVGFFLCNKVTGQQAPYETVCMPECDLYGTLEPWEIFEAYRKDENSTDDLYFFTELKKKNTKEGKRIDRCIATGTWHQENTIDDIHAFAEAKGEWVTATKKRFNYRNKDRPDQDKGWIMFEYACSTLSDNLVACVLRKNLKKKNRSVDGYYCAVKSIRVV